MQQKLPNGGPKASKLEAILNSAVAAIITIDTSGLIDSINPATERIFGYHADELIGQNVRILMPEPFHNEHDSYISNYLSTGRRKIIGVGREVMGKRKDGTTFPLDLSVSEFVAGGKRYFAGIITNLSDRRRVEEALLESERKLAQAQRLEAIGQLTGGIAHDFNNLLTVITGNLELIEMSVQGEHLHKMLRDAQEAADLAAKLTSRLLAFARRSHLEPEILETNDLVLNVTSMLRRTLGEHISLSTVLSPDLWQVKVDPTQAESSLVNLAINARDAMSKGGKLVVETRNIRMDEVKSGDAIELPHGDYVQISISDTGTGMPAEVRDRAFEPFFTTKTRGHGTGLGLSMVYGFAKQSGGHVTIYSELGYGATINIYLPRANGTMDAAVAADAEPSPRRGETVLVVEDDDGVRDLTVTRLATLGFKIYESSDGASAIRFLESGLKVDLLFSDLMLPGGLTGYDIARKAREIYPGIRILLTSGYAEDLLRTENLGGIKLLRKPYRLADLRSALDAVLNGPP
ncbi:PAS domain S-box protein [Nordella sp. HKS 07]|uniref:PAS domain S-box protein n=1 Tax=Nordella sp. HKS 07 TaxID=2712222 RepID=UPI0013E18F43|nr:PAS domain S-box protein [Nordella sp. HKS 07]QIG51038.1 PAS domain S-box protein [Nordella sp. HKS 07]